MSIKAGLMFAGQGAQYAGMGADLYRESESASQIFDKADKRLGWKISELCFNGPVEKLTTSSVCQPAIYTMSQACLAALQDKMTVQPVVCGGLSLGEFSAACAASVFDFEDGLDLLEKRGSLMEQACRQTEGAMAAVLKADREIVERVCRENDVDVANFNCPGQIVISGEKNKIDNAVEALKEAGVSRVTKLGVDGAFHSRLMETASDGFRQVLADKKFRSPECGFVQNYVGADVRDPDEIQENLGKQVTGSVRWEECVKTMLTYDIDMLIELGPGKVLSGFMKRIDRKFPVFNVENMEDVSNLTAEIDEH
ncbi:MAG: ACP S-malonyltransferase [Verrucomicrobiota bacterium]